MKTKTFLKILGLVLSISTVSFSQNALPVPAAPETQVPAEQVPAVVETPVLPAFEVIKQEQAVAGDSCRLFLGGHAGYFLLLTGYPNYGSLNLGYGGMLKIKTVSNGIISPWFFGVGYDLFPLLAPTGGYGVSEDIYAITGFMGLTFFPASFVSPYLSIGVGAYGDHVKMETPYLLNSGVVEYTYVFPGINLKIGIEINMLLITVYGEAGIHAILEPGQALGYYATHAVVTGGVLWNF